MHDVICFRAETEIIHFSQTKTNMKLIVTSNKVDSGNKFPLNWLFYQVALPQIVELFMETSLRCRTGSWSGLRYAPRTVVYGSIDLCGVPWWFMSEQIECGSNQWRAKFHISTVDINTDLTIRWD